MPRLAKDVHRAVDKEVSQWEAAWHTKWPKRGHPRIVLEVGTKTRFVVTPSTVSDYRGIKNLIRDIKHELEGMGAKRKEECMDAGNTMKQALEKATGQKEEKAEPSHDAKRAKRVAVQWLDECFDAEAGQFKGGMSDKTIATEVGVAEKVVAELREEFFGPIREPEQLAEFRQRMDKIEAQAKQFGDDARTMAASLIDEIAKLRANIKQVVERNGW